MLMEQAHKAALGGLSASLEQLEAQIQQAVKEDLVIKNYYDLLISVPGIGHLTAVYLICWTNNFAGARTGKQLASYAGVVPFTQSSGSSIKGRPKSIKWPIRISKRCCICVQCLRSETILSSGLILSVRKQKANIQCLF